MATFKDINQLSQKSAVAGTEKLPVSDTEYITPAQIVSDSFPREGGWLDDDAFLSIGDSNQQVSIALDSGGLSVNDDVLQQSTYYAFNKIQHYGLTFNLPSSSGTLALTSQVPQILSGSSDPTSALGNNGDIYIKLSS